MNPDAYPPLPVHSEAQCPSVHPGHSHHDWWEWCRRAKTAVELPWRTGRKLGRTVYAQIGDTPNDHDIYLGIFDTTILARHVVDTHNATRRGGYGLPSDIQEPDDCCRANIPPHTGANDRPTGAEWTCPRCGRVWEWDQERGWLRWYDRRGAQPTETP